MCLLSDSKGGEVGRLVSCRKKKMFSHMMMSTSRIYVLKTKREIIKLQVFKGRHQKHMKDSRLSCIKCKATNLKGFYLKMKFFSICFFFFFRSTVLVKHSRYFRHSTRLVLVTHRLRYFQQASVDAFVRP